MVAYKALLRFRKYTPEEAIKRIAEQSAKKGASRLAG